MVISHAKKFVVLAPWKAASSTLHARLGLHNESPYSRFYDYNIHLQRVVHQHLTCSDFESLPESRLGYFLASFVRNPYDRAYSGFLQLQRDIAEQPFAPFPSPSIKELVQGQLDANRAQLRRAEFDFDRWIYSLRDFQVFEAGHNSSLPFHPGNYWTHIAGRQRVNYIGRVENFEADFSRMCSMIGIDEPEKANRNVSEGFGVEARGGSAYRHIRRMNRASIDKINQLFRQDFELFGYDMLH